VALRLPKPIPARGNVSLFFMLNFFYVCPEPILANIRCV
jgi:hypothetical protein